MPIMDPSSIRHQDKGRLHRSRFIILNAAVALIAVVPAVHPYLQLIVLFAAAANAVMGSKG